MPLTPTERYDDIIDLPHHRSRTHPHMPRANRAVQFMPFAALTGYDAAIMEAARQTRQRVALSDDEKENVSRKLRDIMEATTSSAPDSRPHAAITYFREDTRKDGGAYVTVAGVVRGLDREHGTLLLRDGTAIPLDDIVDVVPESDGGGPGVPSFGVV